MSLETDSPIRLIQPDRIRLYKEPSRGWVFVNWDWRPAAVLVNASDSPIAAWAVLDPGEDW